MKPKKPVKPETAAPATNKFGIPLKQPSNWSFGGKGRGDEHLAGGKPQKDAERRAGKSRKVH